MDYLFPFIIGAGLTLLIGLLVLQSQKPTPTNNTTQVDTVVPFDWTRWHIPYFFNQYPYVRPVPVPRPFINTHGIPINPVPGRLY